MKIVVIGGSGLIGSKVVARLGERGQEAVPASPSRGVNTLTGEGVKEVLHDANVVVDVSNSPSFQDDDVMEFFRTSTRTLLDAAGAAGVGHYVALSVVGTDRLPESGYLRSKVAQEELITASALPYSIVRATQFFEFAGQIADSATADGSVRLSGAAVQPMAAEDVAAAVSGTAAGDPLNSIVEVAGPEVFGLDRWIGTVLAARHDPRIVITDPHARYFGALPDRELLPGPGANLAQTRLSEWLTRQ
ncbi:NAD(P)H-binding protein [Nocardia sp. SYP-A9097]|uniref:SDR family oxidoreductase n=1 Tax=Nocardia sp. SYP-A9097 TaxID=2663237 RepID=UPI00129ADB14|nr:SDR family oxidoreductase [Nocardia sp. SYP-A9097]MRH92309.1 NAD(P)H-binding protein [Nocardia sp. SYP-A9097]